MSHTIDSARDAGARAVERLDAALDYATQGTQRAEQADEPHRRPWTALRASPRSYTAATFAYLLCFLIVAGAPGTNLPLPSWLATAPAGAITGYLLGGALVAATSAVLAHLVRATPYGRGRWFEASVWPFVAGLAFTAGTAVQMRLSHVLSDATVPALALAVGVLLAGVWSATRADRAGADPRRALAAAWSLAAAAIVVRILTPVLSGGNLARGEALGVNVGEVSRAMVVVAVALALSGVEQQAIDHGLGRLRRGALLLVLAMRLGPMLAYTALLFAVQDRGPAVVLGMVIAAMVLASIPRRSLRQAVPVVLLLAVVTAAVGLLAPVSQVPGVHEAQETLRTRVLDAGCAQGELTQACKSQRILHVTGLAPDVDPFGSRMTHTLEAANSDYAPTLIGGALGMAALLLLLAGVVAVATRIVAAARLAPLPRTEQRDANNRLALGAAMTILVTACWLGMAILLPRIPFTGATLPLTGLDVPFLSANGGSSLTYGFLIGLAVVSLRANTATDTPGGPPRPSGAVGRVTLACLLVMAVGVLWIAFGRGPAAAGAERLQSESLLRDTSGRIITRDGQVFSRPAESGVGGERVYPVPGWAVDLGFYQPGPSINQAVGLEFLSAPLLTCGRHRAGPTTGLLATCRGADMVTTVDGRLQTFAGTSAAAVASGSSPRTTADIVVADRRTGAVRVAASSASQDPLMQSIVPGGEVAWRPSVMFGQDYPEVDPPDGDPITPTPTRIRSYALQMLRPLAATCVDAADGSGNPFDATYGQCLTDRASLQMMHPFRYAAPPGSTFKVISALAAERADTGLPPAGLGDRLTAVGGIPVEPPLNNRSELGACPQETLPAMLQHSCNTTAGWFGMSAGAAEINAAAAHLGFDPADAVETVRTEAGTVYGPPDPSSDDRTPGALYFSTSRTGLDDGETDPSALVRTAIGQQGARASVMDLVGVAGSVADGRIPRMTLVEGICRSTQFEPTQSYAPPSPDLDDAQLAAVRQGMSLSVSGAGGTARGMAAYGVQMAKTGTADDGTEYQRWVMGATRDHVFAARVGPVAEDTTRDRNPAVNLAEAVLGELGELQRSGAWDRQESCSG